jgi:hypothetical protein
MFGVKPRGAGTTALVCARRLRFEFSSRVRSVTIPATFGVYRSERAESDRRMRMATDKDKGLVGRAADGLRETTGALGGGGPWRAADSEVYHNNPNCQTGNSIAPENVWQGTGDKPLCGECERLNGAGGSVGNLTGL